MTDYVTDDLLACFRLALGDPRIEIDSSATVDNVDGWDSFAHINLVLAIEEEFGVEFDAVEISSMTSVKNITTALREKAARGYS
jgi:acyl carrier protein